LLFAGAGGEVGGDNLNAEMDFKTAAPAQKALYAFRQFS